LKALTAEEALLFHPTGTTSISMSCKRSSPTSADGFMKYRHLLWLQTIIVLSANIVEKASSLTRGDQLTPRLRDRMMQESFLSRPRTRTKVPDSSETRSPSSHHQIRLLHDEHTPEESFISPSQRNHKSYHRIISR
jgi:hypothetical protein